jgi:hypothetical protein
MSLALASLSIALAHIYIAGTRCGNYLPDRLAVRWQVLQDASGTRGPPIAIMVAVAILALLVPVLAFQYFRLRARMNSLMVQQSATLVSILSPPSLLFKLSPPFPWQADGAAADTYTEALPSQPARSRPGVPAREDIRLHQTLQVVPLVPRPHPP